jgi:hypothetical protein
MSEQGIHIKVELEREKDGEGLQVKIQFNPSAPNITINDKHEASWYPTQEEVEFINEVFSLIQHRDAYYYKSGYNTGEMKSEKNPSPSDSNENIQPSHSSTTPAGAAEEGSAIEKKKGDGIIISADADTIDEIIRKKKEAEGIILEADENAIIDRVLKKKKREGW